MTGAARRSPSALHDDGVGQALPASLVIVDDWLPIASMLAARYRASVGPAARPVILAKSVAEVHERLSGGDAHEAGRPVLAGALVDLFLGSANDQSVETAFELAAWLEDDRYPLLLPILLTGAEVETVRAVCAARGMSFVDPEAGLPRQLAAFPSDAARAALLGTVVRPRANSIPVFQKDPLIASAETMRYLEHTVFAPWERFCVAARAFALEQAGQRRVELSEHHMRSLDALFESVPRRRVGHARGLTEGSRDQELHRLKTIFGDLEDLYRRWLRAQRATQPDPLWGNRWEPLSPPPPRPSARRGR